MEHSLSLVAPTEKLLALLFPDTVVHLSATWQTLYFTWQPCSYFANASATVSSPHTWLTHHCQLCKPPDCTISVVPRLSAQDCCQGSSCSNSLAGDGNLPVYLSHCVQTHRHAGRVAGVGGGAFSMKGNLWFTKKHFSLHNPSNSPRISCYYTAMHKV